MRTLAAGSAIGILGGGQLGRMTALAAARLGFKAHVFCQRGDEPAVSVCAARTLGSFDDEEALVRFAREVSVVTLEWENVPLFALDVVARHVPVFPDAPALRITQDRGLEKRFVREIGIDTADFAVVRDAQELEKALDLLGCPAILKTARMGYDGRGQVMIDERAKAQEAWACMGGDEGLLEAFVPFEKEVSVIVARGQDGALASFPAVENVHCRHILAETRAPAVLYAGVEDEVQDAARRMATHLHLVGLLAVEFFVLKKPNEKGRRFLVNEMAPRPHNSGHWTIDACAHSQFDMLVRAIAGLPLVSPTPHSEAHMLNILGEDLGKCRSYLADPAACLHLYGKADPREGRKMGHVTFLAGPWKNPRKR